MSGRRRSPRRLAQPVLALAALAVLAGCGDDGGPTAQELAEAEADGTSVDYRFVIPDGTFERMERGEQVEILPAELDVAVGETIQVVNRDDHFHTVGPFPVGPGETSTQQFTDEGEFVGLCTVHPSGQLVLRVS